ncbi:hypothetical protein [Lapillicoccus sp.]|uniref:hypothetical protein n=1 Tax=Lapillicoccus sp. TaxID=1909287 RepID=UPI00398338E8
MLRISRPAAFAAGAVLGLSLLSASAASADDSRSGHDEGDVLRASITGSMTTDPVLFGVKPGGAPWVISRGEARLGGDGRLEVEVRGLIIPTLGTNPVPKISASVVCNGAVVAMTRSVAFSPKGNAEIEATVALPTRCLAPSVLLNPNDIPAVYIAVTGR